jgi:hypothetical protein
MCNRVHDLPLDFDYDPVQQRVVDRAERVELNCATVEYEAPAEYMVRYCQHLIAMTHIIDSLRVPLALLAYRSGDLSSLCQGSFLVC